MTSHHEPPRADQVYASLTHVTPELWDFESFPIPGATTTIATPGHPTVTLTLWRTKLFPRASCYRLIFHDAAGVRYVAWGGGETLPGRVTAPTLFADDNR